MSVPCEELAPQCVGSTYRAIAFGLRWDSDVCLHQFETARHDGAAADIIIERAPGPSPRRPTLVAIDNAALCKNGVHFCAGRETTFDTFGAHRVDWTAGDAWTGSFPPVFFGTVTALLLAWRAAVPIHGTAVEIDGQAVLICGQSGAGKSTLAAGLIAAGAKLISDDLSILHPSEHAGVPMLYAGRPAMRLFPSAAGFLQDIAATGALLTDKHSVLPPRVAPLEPIPLASLILLSRAASAELAPMSTSQKLALLLEQLFRPKWMYSMPGVAQRLATLQAAARELRVVTMPSVEVRDRGTFNRRAAEALGKIH